MTDENIQPCPFCGRKPEVKDYGNVIAVCVNTNCPLYRYGIDLILWNIRKHNDETEN